MLLHKKIWKSQDMYQNCYIFNREKKLKTNEELNIQTSMIVLGINASWFITMWECIFVIHFHIYIDKTVLREFVWEKELYCGEISLSQIWICRVNFSFERKFLNWSIEKNYFED